MRRWSAFASVLSVLLMLVVTASLASAHSITGSGTCWKTSSLGHYKSKTSTIYHNLTGDYGTAFANGSGWWSGTSVNWDSRSPNGAYTVNSPSGGFYGRVIKGGYDAYGDATYWDMELNTYLMDSLTVSQKTYVVGHEIGHVWGLGDVPDSSCAGSALMYGAYNYVSSVLTPDQNGFNYIWN